jgi:thiol-disulfide isomerase/thioredoxin
METLLFIARLILTVVLGVAGTAKLVDQVGSRRALAGFGVPEEWTKPLAWFLPVAELVVALALLPLTTAWFGALGALVLLLAFLLGIGVNLARGETPDCHCFGQLHSAPVSWNVFARNVALAMLAAFILAQGRDNVGWSATAWLREVRTHERITLLLSISAVALLVPIWRLLRRVLKQQAMMLEAVTAMKKMIEEDYAEPAPVEREDAAPPVEGLPVGTPAPEFSFATRAGGRLSLAELLAWGKPVLLLFVSPTCSPCKSLLPQVRIWQRDYGNSLTIALLSKGAEKDVRNKLAQYEVQHVLLQGASSIAEEYQAKWTPAAVLIDPSGKIASPVTSGEAAIRALLTHAVATAEPAPQTGSVAFSASEAAAETVVA